MNGALGSGGFSPDDETPVFVISVAPQLSCMHAQTSLQYDRLGLLAPSRTLAGGGRDAACTKGAGGTNKGFAKKGLPNTVQDDAGRDGVTFTGDHARQFQTTGTIFETDLVFDQG